MWNYAECCDEHPGQQPHRKDAEADNEDRLENSECDGVWRALSLSIATLTECLRWSRGDWRSSVARSSAARATIRLPAGIPPSGFQTSRAPQNRGRSTTADPRRR